MDPNINPNMNPKLAAPPNNFFDSPHNFSFKDGLAVLMMAPFIAANFMYLLFLLNGNHAMLAPLLDYIKTYVAIVMVVLGGYFGQEVATSYFARGNTMNGGMYSYGYGYGTSVGAANTNVIPTEQNSPV